MRAIVTHDPGRFRERLGGWLSSRPVEHNVIVTVAGQTDHGVFAWLEDDDGPRAAALRTPPHPLLASVMGPDEATELMPAFMEADPELPGVNGPEPAAGHLAEAWRARTSGTVAPGMAMIVYALSEVREPSVLPPGHARPAAQAERDLLVAWADAFMSETGTVRDSPELAVDRRMAGGALFVWDDDGPACVVGTSPPVAGIVRISLVYTPAERRRRGYAGALVADVSRRALAQGASRCMLYADRDYPASNSVYLAVGYRQIAVAQEYKFSR